MDRQTLNVTFDRAVLHPAPLRVGDEVRLVSPASPPNRDDVLAAQRTLESWGLKVSLGDNIFRRYGYLAGTDEERWPI